MAEDRAELVAEIQTLCRRQDRRSPENILLIGKSGAGKSAIINTLIRAISGKYFDRAKVGAGETASKTLQLIRYKNCGVVEEDLSDTSVVNRRQLVKLSNVYDVPGLGDSFGEDIKEILRLLIAGRVPDKTGIATLQNLQKEHGVGDLDAVFDTVDPESKINKIVFVQSAVDSVPTQLIDGLHEVLTETDPVTCRLIYEGDIFLLITHYDMVRDEVTDFKTETTYGRQTYVNPSSTENYYEAGDDHSSSENSAKYITRSKFSEKEKLLARLFHIEGALDRNRLHWTSMCDKTGYKDPEICTNALRFLKFMMSPTMPASSPESTPRTVMTPEAHLRLKGRQIKRWMGGDDTLSPPIIIIIILAILVVFLAYNLMSASPDQSFLNFNLTGLWKS